MEHEEYPLGDSSAGAPVIAKLKSEVAKRKQSDFALDIDLSLLFAV